MRFAEVFLRLGSALVGWMLLYAHFLWLAVLRTIGCGPDGDQLHQLLLGLSVLTLGAAMAIHVARPLAEVQQILRWLAIPLALLIPWLTMSIWGVWTIVNINASAICGSGEPVLWHEFWAPVQVLVVLSVGYSGWRLWRDAG